MNLDGSFVSLIGRSAPGLQKMVYHLELLSPVVTPVRETKPRLPVS